MTKWVYHFGDGQAEGDGSQKELLGGKGANLAQMCAIGLPVPPGFTLSTQVCTAYYGANKSYPDTLAAQVLQGIADIEAITGRRFGDSAKPLLLSVRSGARVSMPGMMDTVLNLGLNDQTVAGLAKSSGDPRFAWDSYRRFVQMYADVVLGVDHYLFEDLIDLVKQEKGVSLDINLEAADWQRLVGLYFEKIEEELGTPFPQDVHQQLWGAISAVFGSWHSERAKIYRRINDIPESWGTAVTIQAMVFGNRGETSATGVAFTRDPATGERAVYGEYLLNAQGEDVVAGIRTPNYLSATARLRAGAEAPSLEEALPQTYKELTHIFALLETHYRDMQDIEFTVEEGKLWMLQTRSGKRTAKAALKIAVDMVAEGLLTQTQAILRLEPAALDQLLHPTLDPKAKRDVFAKGLPASPGAASGLVVFDSQSAEALARTGQGVILCRVETSPEDIQGMHAARGILTCRGGMTSHAAVVARGMGRPCVSGAGSIAIDVKNKTMRCAGREVRAGDLITIDGSTGEVMLGAVPTLVPELAGDFATLMHWADAHRRLKIRANAETPHDAQAALDFGAEGIGLCRTEHMFFDAGRIGAVRQMILAENEKGRRAALDKLLPMQRQDFVDIFTLMAGLPVTVRLLDPPLHEFLPHSAQDFAEVAAATGVSIEAVHRRVNELHEFNPMLGHRGCRLGITYPEIYEMQTRALFEAALSVARQTGQAIVPEIMIPLVATRKELALLKTLVERTAQAVFAEQKDTLAYQVGTMIELPRAALLAREIAEEAEFFSFGTNDLTQTTLGISRDDANRFLTPYVDKGIYEKDPFVTLDCEGVGELIALAVSRGRAQRPDLKLGICGEHGGDPASIAFCEQLGLDYVSCSPYRVPIARLAAAQAALRLALKG
jgi:pyruvate, orthophosphate dikinase